MNIVMLTGKLSSAPQVRTLPSDTLLVTYELTTRLPDGSAATTPVAWMDPPPRLPQFEAGDEITVVGHVRRRFFRGAAGTQSRTEVMADAVVSSRQAKRAQGLIAKALAQATAEGAEEGSVATGSG